MKSTFAEKIQKHRDERRLPVVEGSMTKEEIEKISWKRLEMRTGIKFNSEEMKTSKKTKDNE